MEVSRSYGLRPIKKHLRYPLRSISTATGRPMKRPIIKLDDVDQNENDVKRMSTLNFLALNDNCLLHVYENLSLADLCSMAEVSVRLKQLAQYLFRLKYRNFDMKLLTTGNDKITMTQARRLFYNFGHLMISLRVSRKDFVFDQPMNNPFKGQQRLFFLIDKYCSLDSLTLDHFWINMSMIRDSVSIFKTLKTLYFYRVSCYCNEEKTFHHFGNVLPLIFQNQGLTRQTPQIIQLV